MKLTTIIYPHETVNLAKNRGVRESKKKTPYGEPEKQIFWRNF